MYVCVCVLVRVHMRLRVRMCEYVCLRLSRLKQTLERLRQDAEVSKEELMSILTEAAAILETRPAAGSITGVQFNIAM